MALTPIRPKSKKEKRRQAAGEIIIEVLIELVCGIIEALF